MPNQFDPTKPVQTRDGRKARIICTDAKSRFSIIALVEGTDEEEAAHSYQSNGRWTGAERDSKFDLVNIPTKKKGWINVYRVGGVAIAGEVYATEADAENHAGDLRVACTRIEWEE